MHPAWGQQASGIKITKMNNPQVNHTHDSLTLYSNILDAGFETLIKKLPNNTAHIGNKQNLASSMWPNLEERLHPLVEPTLMSHFLVAKEGLTGDTVLDKWKAYCSLLNEDAVKDYFTHEFPLLTERVTLETAHWILHQSRLCERYILDVHEIGNSLFGGASPGCMLEVQSNLGDKHLGESVSVVTLENKQKVMYIPRNRSAHQHLQPICDWINTSLNAGLRLPAIVSRPTHAWVEFIPHTECRNEDQVHRYFERLGMWLAIFYTLDATDFHYENLIACGEYPIPVDLETLFHPFMPFEENERHNGIFNSVLNTGILPTTFGMDDTHTADMSGVSNPEGETTLDTALSFILTPLGDITCRRQKRSFSSSQNLPLLNGKIMEPTVRFAEDLKRGFRRTYLFLCKYNDIYLSYLEAFRQDHIRLLFRNTATYSHLLREGAHPDALRNEEAREKQLKWLEVITKEYPEASVFIEAEKNDMRRGDIPCFHTRADSTDIHHGNTCVSSRFFKQSGFETARQKIIHLSQEDLNQQCWIIDLSLSLLNAKQPVFPADTPDVSCHKPLSMIDAACLLADNLIKTLSVTESRANWMVFTPIDLESSRFSLAPASYDLYSGLPGEILCLTVLSRQTGIKHYKEVADKALNELLARLEAGSSLNKLGLFAGWGGLLYTMSFLSQVYNDPKWLNLASSWLDGLNPCEMMQAEDNHGVVNGTAGFILALLAAYQVGKEPRLLEMADKLGSALLRKAIRTDEQIRWKSYSNKPLAGLSHGASGYAVCYSRLFKYTGTKRYKEEVRKILQYETHLYSTENRNWPDLRSVMADRHQGQTTFSTAWSHGAPGIGLARLEVLKCGIRHKFIFTDLDNALKTCLESGFDGGDNLCFGAFGNLELLINYAEYFTDDKLKDSYRELAQQLVTTGLNKGFNITGKSMYTPGFMNGITGIIYQCLRVNDPKHVPSILGLTL